MRRAIGLAVPTFVVALAATGMCAVGTGSAQRDRLVRVAVGELAGARVPRAFSSAVDEALRTHDEVRVTPRGRADLVVRGSVVRWQRQEVEGATEVRCEVSMVLADAHGGSIRAMLRGRGGARGNGALDQLSHDALRAAVRGALRPLGQQGRALARRP